MKPNHVPVLIMLLLVPVLLAACLLFGASGIGIPTDRNILLLRLNRVAAGFIVGAALSCAGVVFQALLRNPLAEPYILGVSSGAGLGAAIAILTGLTALSALVLPITAFVAAILTLAAVYRLANTGATPSTYSLIMSGVIVSAMCASVLMYLVSTASSEGLRSITWWMLGSLQVSSVELLRLVGFLVGTGCLGIWLLSPELNALSLGTDVAHYVGVRTTFAVSVGLALATLLAASAVSLAGLIGFVGLIVPHVVRALTGSDHRLLVPCASLVGGAFLAACDAAARTVLAAHQIPVGVVTALLGGPFFIVILRQRKQRGWIE